MPRLTIPTLLLAAIILAGTAPHAFAAQLSWDARTLERALEPKLVFQRTVSIEYEDGGIIADQLNGQHLSVKFSSDPSTKGTQELIEKLNHDFEQRGIYVRVSDMEIDYSAELIGRESDASIDYKITMVPTINGFLIREYEDGTTALFDVAWRGIQIEGPIVLSDENQELEINMPISLLQKEFPLVHERIAGTEAEPLLSTGMIDSSGIGNVQITRWHSLFDPTAIVAESERYGFKGDVVTTFSMGESTIFLPSSKKVSESIIVSDKQYKITTTESADNANIFILGYASSTFSGQTEVISTSPKAPPGVSINPTGQFPIFIIYGMAGMAAAGAGGFFWWSSKKAKKELSLGQKGIDPSLLRGVETSAASGGYRTNRGEAHLRNDAEYDQTRSVYGNGNSKKTLPKGWQKSEVRIDEKL